jgi:hypothetical protein
MLRQILRASRHAAHALRELLHADSRSRKT